MKKIISLMILIVLACSIPSVYARSYGVTCIAKGNNGRYSSEDYSLNIVVHAGTVVEGKDYLYHPSGSIHFNNDDVQISGSSIWRWGYRVIGSRIPWEQVLIEGVVKVNSQAGWWIIIEITDEDADRKNLGEDRDPMTIDLWAPNSWSINEVTLEPDFDLENPDYTITVFTYMYRTSLPPELPII